MDANGELLFPKLDIDCFADDDSRLVVGEYQDYPPTEPTEPGAIPDPEEYINTRIGYLKDSIKWYAGVGSPGRRGVSK